MCVGSVCVLALFDVIVSLFVGQQLLLLCKADGSCILVLCHACVLVLYCICTVSTVKYQKVRNKLNHVHPSESTIYLSTRLKTMMTTTFQHDAHFEVWRVCKMVEGRQATDFVSFGQLLVTPNE
jgi:hypothetical protein